MLTFSRKKRGLQTIAAMLKMFCQDHHHTTNGLCPDCQALLDYSRVRLDRCVFGEAKPTCANCPVHCYRPAERAQMRSVMRHAGPRMLRRHPILTLLHLLDGRRKVEPPPGLKIPPPSQTGSARPAQPPDPSRRTRHQERSQAE